MEQVLNRHRRRFPDWYFSLWQAVVTPLYQEKEAEATNANRVASELLDTYGNSILRLAYSYVHNMEDAEEILQDTLIQYLKKRPSFSAEYQKKAWLMRVASNLSKNKIDYNRLRHADELSEQLTAASETELSFLWEAVKDLPAHYREVIHLFYYEGFSSKEIATILDCRESTVRSRLKRGREQLKTVLKEAYDFD